MKSIRIIDFLELFKDFNNKDEIIVKIYDHTDIVLKCSIENFRKKLNGIEYKALQSIDLSDGEISLFLDEGYEDNYAE